MKVYHNKSNNNCFCFEESKEVNLSLENVEDHPIDESDWQVDNFPK